MPEVIILKGLPGSGKSTWAKQQVEANPGQYKRVNKDDLRSMLDGGRWSKQNEQMVLDLRDSIIRVALERNCHILVDDTNLSNRHEERIRHLVSEINKLEGKQHRVRVQDFTEVPLETCIERDLMRPQSVGEKVIRGMYDQFLKPPADPEPEWDVTFPSAILCDLDGTLANLNGRNPYDASTCDADGLNIPVANALIGFRHVFSDLKVILLSGRPDTHRAPTERFLDRHQINHDQLLMRGADDRRKDDVVKREIYETHIKGKYNVVAVFDDRISVARLWFSLGLPLFRVGDPDADF
jgi:predicted kinase